MLLAGLRRPVDQLDVAGARPLILLAPSKPAAPGLDKLHVEHQAVATGGNRGQHARSDVVHVRNAGEVSFDLFELQARGRDLRVEPLHL